MEKLNLSSDSEETQSTNEIEDSPEKPEFVKKIENFDVQNLSPENVEFMNHCIQEVFRKNFPVEGELIDKIPEYMNLVDGEGFVRAIRESGEEPEERVGFYSQKNNQIYVDVSHFHSPGALFSTMFHESLHFVSIQSGAGLRGGFSYRYNDEEDEGRLLDSLDKGIKTLVEGTTQNITMAYIFDYMGFDQQPEVFSYEPECLITRAILDPFSVKEKYQLYFNTPLEMLRVYIENAFEDDYDVDEPTGLFANCIVNIAKATEKMETALDSWRKDNNPEPVEKVLSDVRHAVGLFLVKELKNGNREISDEEEERLQDYLAPYKVES